MAKSVMKKKRVSKVLIRKSTLSGALRAGLKAKTGRKDIKFKEAAQVALSTEQSVPIAQRAGYPLKLTKGGVNPKDWVTCKGDKILVDFARAPWLPDDWGQGVKMTRPVNKKVDKGGGGILTCYVAPDGKNFFHKLKSEEYAGVDEFTRADGWNGQVRLAKAQAEQAIQLARNQLKEVKKGGGQELRGTDSDEAFFKILSPTERRNLPSKDELHVGVVSARRAKTVEGVRDIYVVESQFNEAGIQPTWYVDESSLKDYQVLGLKAKVGGKLTQARNMVLRDARKLGKACVEVSDDISSWEYRHGKNAADKSDDAKNRAYEAARRFIISPVAAARFILAKMRSAEEPKPQLGGVYMLGSCARTFGGEAFSRHNFIIGDFFVVDKSTVTFDENMRLKEDYDFTCSHIKKHGSVMRCNRLTLNVKHYANSGGAVSNRDSKGLEEQRNIAILKEKWPGCFMDNWKRKNEVIMRWKGAPSDDDDEDAADSGRKASHKSSVKKSILKKKPTQFGGLKPTAIIKQSGKTISSPYIASRCKKVAGRTVQHALSATTYNDSEGEKRTYLLSDLRYDLNRGYLELKQR